VAQKGCFANDDDDDDVGWRITLRWIERLIVKE
jgi:hypothetical protein